jgi:glycine cleavage system H protein
MAYPNEYQYTKEHEWIKVEGTLGIIGITDHAQEALGDIVFVELPKPGAEVQAGKTFGTVESVKAVSDIYSPVTGVVSEVNTELTTTPEKINQDAHQAWLIKVQLKNPAEVNALMSAADYEKFLREEGVSGE